MSKLIDMTGKKCGRLLVLRYVGLAKWECLCDCGNTVLVRGADLRDKSTKSCGCLNKEISRRNMTKMMGSGISSKNYMQNRELVGFRLVLASYRLGAKNRDLEFFLKEDFAINLMKSNCYYCGRPPSNVKKIEFSDTPLLYNGIDRVENNIGYTEKNVVPCCKTCNMAKNNMGLNEFLSWIKSVFWNRHLGEGYGN